MIINSFENYNTHPPSHYIWRRLKKNRLAVIGIFTIAVSILIALFSYLIMPDSTPMANEMSLQISTKKPGFSVKTLLVRKNRESRETNFIKKIFFGEENDYALIPINNFHFEGDKIVFEEYADKPTEAIPQKGNLADIVYSLSLSNPDIKTKGDLISFVDFNGRRINSSISDLRKKIEKEHIVTKTYYLGTDRFGRDMLSRLLAGTKVSLSVGLISVIISLVIGISFGSLAGFFRGKVDGVIMWLINVIWSIPTLLLVIAITLALGRGFWQVFVAVGLTMWVEVARVVRGQIFSIREMEFVEAGRALGYNNYRIITKHILPNIMGPVIVISAANFASAILLEAGLSFLGVGAQPPMPSWGVMIKENYGYIIADASYLAVLPGLAIMIMVLAFNLVGNGLRDAFDSKETIY